DLGVGAAAGDQGDQLPFPGTEGRQVRRGGRFVRLLGDEQQDVLGGGGRGHGGAALFRRASQGGPQRLPCPVQRLPELLLSDRVICLDLTLYPGGPPDDGEGRPCGNGLSPAPRCAAQAHAHFDAV